MFRHGPCSLCRSVLSSETWTVVQKGNRTSPRNSSGYMQQVVCLQCTRLCACVYVLVSFICACAEAHMCTKAGWESLASYSIHLRCIPLSHGLSLNLELCWEASQLNGLYSLPAALGLLPCSLPYPFRDAEI